MSSPSVTPQQIEAKLREIQGGLQGQIADKKQTALAIAGGVGLIILILMFLLGRKSGRKKTNFIEIRRV